MLADFVSKMEFRNSQPIRSSFAFAVHSPSCIISDFGRKMTIMINTVDYNNRLNYILYV